MLQFGGKMEKLLNLLSSKLQIRTHAAQQPTTISVGYREFVGLFKRFEYRDAPERVKALFKEKLEEHIFSKTEKLNVGEKIAYSFDYRNVRPLGTLMYEANDNMAEVLLALPKLGNGEYYALPLDTYFSLEVTEKTGISTTSKLKDMSWWINKEYNK